MKKVFENINDKTEVEVENVYELTIRISDNKIIKVYTSLDCTAYYDKNENKVHVIQECESSQINILKGKSPGIVCDGNLNIGNITGQFAIGSYITQNQNQNSNESFRNAVVLIVPKETKICVTNVENIKLENNYRIKKENIKENSTWIIKNTEKKLFGIKET